MAYGRDKNSFVEKSIQSNQALYTMQNQGMTLFPIRRRDGAIPRENMHPQPHNDGIDSRETYHTNRNLDWSRTSFKVKKSKPGKIRHLSKQELFGIGMSFLLSVCMAIFIAFALLHLSPIVLRHLTNFIYDVNEVGTLAKKTFFPTQIKGSSTTIALQSNISEKIFSSQCFKQAPCLFSLSDTPNASDKFYDFSAISMESLCSKPSPRETELAAQSEQFITLININATDNVGPIPNTIPLLSSIFSNSNTLQITKPTQDMKSSQFKVGKGFASLLLEGKKKWVVFKQDNLPKKGLNTKLRLEDFNQNQFDDDIFHVIFQNVMEYVYIPEGWMYAFEILEMNMSASVDFEVKQLDSSSYLQFYLQGRDKLDLGDMVAAIKFFKLGLALNRNILLLEGLGDALTANSQFLAAEEFYREVLLINPQSISVYSKLINLLVNHSHKDVSESIGELLTLASEAGVRDAVIKAIQ